MRELDEYSVELLPELRETYEKVFEGGGNMKINKDTANAVNAAETLINYCARYKDCKKCVFWHESKFGISCCSVGCPFEYKMIFSPFEEKGAQHEEK